MVGSFKQYLVEEEKVVFFSFGRMNPPTIGHGKLLDKLASTAGRNPYRMYLSQSVDAKKNPLGYRDKIKFVRKMFPRHARSIMLNNNIRNAMEVASALYKEGYRKIVMVVGDDRVREFDILLNKYNGEKARHGFYNFMDIKVISAGSRDPDAEGVEGMSASKMRDAVSSNDFTQFAQGLPKNFSNADSKSLFNAVRKGMGLKESTDFRNHIQLAPVSDVRESYVDGKLFEVGDQVVIKENGEIGKVKRLGSNYVIIESKSNEYRKWLDAVEKVEPQGIEWTEASFSVKKLHEKSMYKDKPDWGTPESTKKAKKITPGQNEEFDIEEITADFSVDKQGELTVGLDDLNESCWPGYKQVGLKNKNGKQVPNCVPEKIEVPQDKDIDDKEGSQPATFHKGIKSKSTKSARDAHFKKMSKRDDHKNPDLYKDAPGDKAARKKGTKPSPYTLRFKNMYGEDMDMVKDRISQERQRQADTHSREKEQMKVKHDRMRDSARRAMMLKKNKGVTGS